LHFHRLLHEALAQAVKWQLLARNPADAVEPPSAERQEMRALGEHETISLLNLLGGSRLYMPTLLAVTTGLRRGKILGLLVQALEQTKDGLRFQVAKDAP
jgi:integrase